MYKRLLEDNLPKEQSFFLFGPRQTGKTTLLSTLRVEKSVNLLDHQIYLNYNGSPSLLYEEVKALAQSGPATVWIDEVQKIPHLLDSVQQCMSAFPSITFILSGSSARKLRRGSANLLGGRALDLKLHPLTISEMADDFSITSCLTYGSLPHIVTTLQKGNEKDATRLLRSYVSTYLAEEIRAEALVRNLENFQNFLSIAAQFCGNRLNLSNLAAKVQISRYMVEQYFSILEDTLIGFFLYPYFDSSAKQASKQPKFYFFDNGVQRAILGSPPIDTNPQLRGHLFEQWVIQEVRRLNHYLELDLQLSYWRTKAGAEVDLLLSRAGTPLMAIECKSSATLSRSDFSGLHSLRKTLGDIPSYIITPSATKRIDKSGIVVTSCMELPKLIEQL